MNVYSFAHLQHYSDVEYLEYDLYRNNSLIGSHKYNFVKNGDNLSVKSVVNFKITKLGIDLYKYFAESTENYHKNAFVSFSSTTVQNKKNKYVKINLNKDKNKLYINGSSYKGTGNLENIIGNWWNHRLLQSDTQISPLSGSIKKQSVEFLKKEKITLYENEINVEKFRLKSTDESLPKDKRLDFEIWYDKKRAMIVKIRYKRLGTWEYRLKKVN